MAKEKILNLPNLLSAYRILALPFIIWTITAGDKQLYITLLSINLITDILDGLIARTFKLETEFGARLDSIADIGTYIMAFSGMIVLQSDFVAEHSVPFIILMSLYFLPQLIALIKFKKSTSLHLYSSKTVAYMQGIFIFTFFLFGYSKFYFYFMVACSYLAYLEALVIVLFIPQLRSNVKGIYFMLKEHKKIM
jgi:cardiolipin synthase